MNLDRHKMTNKRQNDFRNDQKKIHTYQKDKKETLDRHTMTTKRQMNTLQKKNPRRNNMTTKRHKMTIKIPNDQK